MKKKEPSAPSEPTPGDDLYTLPLQQFTAARNALAASLKKAGQTEEAERVRSLPRPSLSAWTVNHLYWFEREQFETLLDAGEQFRAAQQAQLAGKSTDLLPALDAKRNAIASLTKAAARILHDAGHSPTPDMMRRVTTSLDAIAALGRGPGAPAHGRLMADVPPPGFEALAALVPRVGSQTVAGHGTRRVLTFGERSDDPSTPRGRTKDAEALRRRDLKARHAQAASVLKDAEGDLRQARSAAQKSRDAMKTAAARAAALDRTAATASARAEQAVAAAEVARRDARKAAADAETAVQILQDAELALERARARAKSVE